MFWQKHNSEYLISNKWVRLRKDHVILPNKREIEDFYVIERPNLVHVIAITSDNQYILEKQYRYAINRECYEICAGLIEQGETPLEAAKRELLEETGYAGGNWIPYGEYAIDPSNMTDISYAFIAKGVCKIRKQNLDPTELISVETVSSNELFNLLQSGKIVSGLMAAPLWRYFAENKL